MPHEELVNVLAILPQPALEKLPLLGRIIQKIPKANWDWWMSYLPWYHKIYSLIGKSGRSDRCAGIDISNYDVAFIVRVPTLWWLDWKFDIPTILDIDDVMHLALRETYVAEKSHTKRFIAYLHFLNVRHAERASLQDASFALVCSEQDKSMLNAGNVRVLPNVFPDRGQLERIPPLVTQKVILFVGSLVYKPNREGLEYFVKEIFPLIRRARPEVVLRVVGRSNSEQALPWLCQSGIEFLGTVTCVDAAIESAAISICPLLSGLGTRIKILESLSFGKPVVSTKIGAYGIDLDESHGLYRANDPERFAEICVSLLDDRAARARIVFPAKNAVAERYGQNAIDIVIRELIMHCTRRQ